ncbi:MAG: hypothetical protein JWR18_1357 [Segetibacter sp.]|jgi:hypothetical protein|nr:hypothetical protein [Segetibacter sp.]
MPALSNAQLEILKLFHENQSQEELYEIKQLLSEYLANKLMKEIGKESLEKGYTPEIIESWKDEHFRTPYR